MPQLYSRILIYLSLLLVLFAYVPTLKYDYVTQDQWRAFRYSILANTPDFRARACFERIAQAYLVTGRPFVWWGEYIEHVVVEKIADFKYLRPFVLGLVMFTVLFLGSILAPYVGGPLMGIIAASLFVFAPGYSFMYLQGMTAFMVLLSAVLAGWAFLELSRWLDRSADTKKNQWHLLKAMLLFISACMMYPSWAFIVVTMALVRFGFNIRQPMVKRLTDLFATCIFLISTAVVYYLLIKVWSLWAVPQSHQLKAPGYEFLLQLNPAIVWRRVGQLCWQFTTMPLLNFNTPAGCAVAMLGIFSMSSVQTAPDLLRFPWWKKFLWGMGVFVLSGAVLIFSLSPWLFSHMDELPSRYLLPWYLFFCAIAIGLIAQLIQKTNLSRKFIPAAVVVLILMPIAWIQNRYSFIETVISGEEIAALRTNLGKWLDQKGYENKRYLYIVRPQVDRPVFFNNLWIDNKGLGENALLSSAKNPVGVPMMIFAVLRERTGHPVGKSIGIANCTFKKDCVQEYLAKGEVAIEITNGDVPVKNLEQLYIINMSLLTDKPIDPLIGRLRTETAQ